MFLSPPPQRKRGIMATLKIPSYRMKATVETFFVKGLQEHKAEGILTKKLLMRAKHSFQKLWIPPEKKGQIRKTPKRPLTDER